jgi:Xaa-Pro aminopeptidase
MSVPDVTHRTERAAEVTEKLLRVRELLERERLDGCLLSGSGSVAWLTAGMTDPIVRGAEPGSLRVLVTAERACVLADNIEATRIQAEDPPGQLGLDLVARPWFEDGLERFALDQVPAERLGNDGFGPGRDLRPALIALRMRLLPGERRRLRRLGRDAARALEGAVRELRPGATERELAAEVARRCELGGMFPQVLLVSGESRRRFRHPVPRALPIARDVLAVACVERGGQFVALSRSACFGDPDPRLEEDHRVACAVDAELIAATRPGAGRTYEEVLDSALPVYERFGRPGEWQRHHQGGPIGYASRESLAYPGAGAARATHPIEVGNAVAWNPSAGRAKSEDTFLVEEDANRPVTVGDGWPTLTLESPAGPIERPAILRLD